MVRKRGAFHTAAAGISRSIFKNIFLFFIGKLAIIDSEKRTFYTAATVQRDFEYEYKDDFKLFNFLDALASPKERVGHVSDSFRFGDS